MRSWQVAVSSFVVSLSNSDANLLRANMVESILTPRDGAAQLLDFAFCTKFLSGAL